MERNQWKRSLKKKQQEEPVGQADKPEASASHGLAEEALEEKLEPEGNGGLSSGSKGPLVDESLPVCGSKGPLADETLLASLTAGLLDDKGPLVDDGARPEVNYGSMAKRKREKTEQVQEAQGTKTQIIRGSAVATFTTKLPPWPFIS